MHAEVTFNKRVSVEVAQLAERILENQLGADVQGKVYFAATLGDETLAFKFVGSSALEPEVNAEIRVFWRDL